MEHYNKYIINIFERYTDLKQSKKEDFDNNDLWKIFEYYSCIKLSEEYKKPFYEYNDIDPNFKELNNMSRNDTGIDCSDLINTIVQCKLRGKSLRWEECSTFFGGKSNKLINIKYIFKLFKYTDNYNLIKKYNLFINHKNFFNFVIINKLNLIKRYK